MAEATQSSPIIEVSGVMLAELDSADDSVLVQALRRLSRESKEMADGITAHSSSQHNSFSQGSW